MANDVHGGDVSNDELAQPEQQAETNSSSAARRFRWRRALIFLLIAALIGVYFIPMGVAHYLQTNGFTITGEGEERFQVDIGEARLGWLSPIRLFNVTIEDSTGQRLLTVPSLASERSLASIATNRQRPGRFFIQQPRVDVIVRPEGSNLDDFLNALSRPGSDSELLHIGGTISQGILSFVDTAGRQLTQIEEIEGSGEQHRGKHRKFKLELSSVVVNDEDRHPLETAVDWEGPDDGLPFLSGAGTAAIDFAPIPLSTLQSQLARFVPGLEVRSGSLEVRR